MKWWTTIGAACMTVLFVVAVLLGVTKGAMDLAVWSMIGFIVSGAISLFVVYAIIPIARPVVQKHVMLLSTSYMLFSITPLLHGLGLWPHEELSDVLWVHFGVPGFCLLVVASLTGFVGLILAAQAIEERLRSAVMNDAESLPTSK